MKRFSKRPRAKTVWLGGMGLAVLLLAGLLYFVAAGGKEAASTAPRAGSRPDKAVMSQDEQLAWDELAAMGVMIYGDGGGRQNLQYHLASLKRGSFPPAAVENVRAQLGKPIRSADLWRVPENGWRVVARLKSLEELEVIASDLDSEAFRQIAQLPNLRRLQVVTGTCLPTDAAELTTAKSLEQLDLAFTVFEVSSAERQMRLGDLSDAERAWAEDHLEAHPRREHIVEAALLTDRMLERLRELPNLKKLRLVNTSISSRGVEAIAVHAELEELEGNFIELTPDAARTIAQLSHLRRLRYANASDETVAALAGLTKLEELDVWAGDVSDAGVRHLVALQSLRSLGLRGSSISDKGLLELSRLPNLDRLDLKYAAGPLSPEGLAEFQRRRPMCRVLVAANEPREVSNDERQRR